MGNIDFGVNMPMNIPPPPIRTMEDRFGANQQIPATNLPYNVPQGPQVNTPAVNLPFRPPNFGQTPPQPFQPQQPIVPPQPTPQPQGQPPVDFAGEYAKLNANRPNRLAYQQSINQGEPIIQRGKLAKLGALIAAAGGSMGPGGAQAGMNLGLSAYQEPQRRATELFEKKQRGLGQMAQFEEQDIANQIKALEMKQSDYYKGREDVRQQTESERQGKLTESQLAHVAKQMEQLDLEEWVDKRTGIKYKKNLQTGKLTEIGKTELSPEEEATFAGSKAGAEATAREKSEKARHDADRAARSADVAAQIGGRESVANIQANKARELAANKAKALAKPMRPGDVYGNILLDFAEEVGKEDSPLEPRMLDWIKPNEAGIPTVTGDWRSTTEQEDKVRRFISEAIAKRRAVPGAAAPKVPDVKAPTAKLPPGWSR